MPDCKRKVIQTDGCPSAEARVTSSADSRWVCGRCTLPPESLSRALCVSPLLSVLPVFDSFLNKIRFGGSIWRRRLTTHHLLRRRNRLGSILLARCCPQGHGLLSGRARACRARGYAYASDLRVCISAARRARQQPCCVCVIPGYFQTLFPSTRAPPLCPTS